MRAVPNNCEQLRTRETPPSALLSCHESAQSIMASPPASLPPPSEADVQKMGAWLGYCALCQNPLFRDDLEGHGDIVQRQGKALAKRHEVPKQLCGAFLGAKEILLCSKSASSCTRTAKKKLQEGQWIPGATINLVKGWHLFKEGSMVTNACIRSFIEMDNPDEFDKTGGPPPEVQIWMREAFGNYADTGGGLGGLLPSAVCDAPAPAAAGTSGVPPTDGASDAETEKGGEAMEAEAAHQPSFDDSHMDYDLDGVSSCHVYLCVSCVCHSHRLPLLSTLSLLFADLQGRNASPKWKRSTTTRRGAPSPTKRRC